LTPLQYTPYLELQPGSQSVTIKGLVPQASQIFFEDIKVWLDYETNKGQSLKMQDLQEPHIIKLWMICQ